VHTTRSRSIPDRDHTRLRTHAALPVAASCSVALHLAALGLIALWYGGASQPALYPSALVLTIEALRPDHAADVQTATIAVAGV
jgi:hypothetical protein